VLNKIGVLMKTKEDIEKKIAHLERMYMKHTVDVNKTQRVEATKDLRIVKWLLWLMNDE
jgi:hypothetical protein